MTEAVLEAGSWIYKMLVTLVLAVICVGIVSLVVTSEANTIDLQRELLFNRILYDPHGYLSTDDSGVTHVATINLTRFTQEHTDKTFVYLPNYGGAEIVLIEGGTRTTVLVNGPTYTNLRVTITGGTGGRGIANSGTLVTRSYPVRIQDGNALRHGWLVITVAMPARA